MENTRDTHDNAQLCSIREQSSNQLGTTLCTIKKLCMMHHTYLNATCNIEL